MWVLAVTAVTHRDVTRRSSCRCVPAIPSQPGSSTMVRVPNPRRSRCRSTPSSSSRRVGRARGLAERALLGLARGDYAGLTFARPVRTADDRRAVGERSGRSARPRPTLRTGRRSPERVAVELGPWARARGRAPDPAREPAPGAVDRPAPAALLRPRARGDRRAGPCPRARDPAPMASRPDHPHRLTAAERSRSELGTRVGCVRAVRATGGGGRGASGGSRSPTRRTRPRGARRRSRCRCSQNSRSRARCSERLRGVDGR